MFIRRSWSYLITLLLAAMMSLVAALPDMACAQNATGIVPIPQAEQSWTGPLGIAAKKPVYAGGCKACPFGELGYVTKEALAFYGYDVHVCTTCATSLAATDMSLKETKQQAEPDPYSSFRLLIENTPPVVPDISTGNDVLMSRLLHGEGDSPGSIPSIKSNLRLIVALNTPTWYVVAVRRSLGITSLTQLKNRRDIWIYGGANSPVLKYYGLTREMLQKNGGGFVSGSDREHRASADVWIGDLASLTGTWENRMWGEITQMNDLTFLQLDEALLDQLVSTGEYERSMLPLAYFRGVDRPIRTVSRTGATYTIYVRDDAPDDFAYTMAKAFYEHRDIFRRQLTPFYYDSELATKSVLPLHPGAAKYYKEIGFLK
jgi:TRAP-type uncharacterized transport system substrate-binding protein